MKQKITLPTLVTMKQAADKIVCLTAYDASFARILDEQNVDVILVGDSLGMVIQGAENTLGVSVADMIYHTRNVSHVCERSLIVTDMPFMSYTTPAQALGNAGRMLAEGGTEVVKLEGGAVVCNIVEHLVKHGIPVCGHLGLTPQSIHQIGGYRAQGREPAAAERIKADARALEQAGASMLVLECVPKDLAKEITDDLKIPVIGIGAGVDCDGQVLVLQDMLGISNMTPRFCKNFLTGSDSVQQAIRNYVAAVRQGLFPGVEHETAA